MRVETGISAVMEDVVDDAGVRWRRRSERFAKPGA